MAIVNNNCNRNIGKVAGEYVILRPVKRGVSRYKGIVMQKRSYLLFVLFVVVAAFYTSVTRMGTPAINAEQQAQTDRFNRLDEVAVAREGEAETSSSGN